MIIYGTKPIHLKTVDIPIACSNCGHDRRHIDIYRNFVSFFFIPVFPMHKQAIVNCPNCKKEQTKKEFLKEFEGSKEAATLNELLKFMMKEARAPLYAYMTTALAFTLVFGVIAWVYHENQKSTLLAASYAQEPKANVIAIVRSEGEAYPYDILYISHILDQEAVVFQWKYSYESLSHAQKGIPTVISNISGNKEKKNFLEPIMASLEAFHEVDFVSVYPLTITAIDLEQFQENSNAP